MIRFKKVKVLALAALAALVLVSYTPGDRYFEIAKNLDIFATLFEEVNRYYVDDVSPTDLMNTGISAMLSTLDPYTNYIPEEDIEDYRTMTTGEYGGIGVLVGSRNDKVLVLMPNEGYAAHKAGLRIGDEIIKVDGISVQGQGTNDISRLLKGQAGTEVVLTIRRFGVEKPMQFSMKREKITVNNVPYYGMVTEDVGIIQLTDFTRNASKEVKTALSELKEKGAKKIILDLRGNPGGLLSEAINVSNIFLPKGVDVVKTKGKIEDWNRTHKALNNPVDTDIPIAVLVSGTSASAAEIVSGVIQDYDRGVLVGRKSFGKGLVQATRPLSYNSKLKVTVAKYYIPSGRCIQEIDYSHRNESGMAEKLPDSLRTAFTTANGRVVYDGGGVSPDVQILETRYAEITNSLVNKGLIFDFATMYAHHNPNIGSARNFKLKDADYEKFVEWLKDKDYDYNTRVERSLENLVASAKADRYYEDIKKQIDALHDKIHHNKEADVRKFSAEIKEVLETEIASRYFLQSGIIESSFDNDPDITAAVSVLNDTKRYQEILKGKK